MSKPSKYEIQKAIQKDYAALDALASRMGLQEYRAALAKCRARSKERRGEQKLLEGD